MKKRSKKDARKSFSPKKSTAANSLKRSPIDQPEPKAPAQATLPIKQPPSSHDVAQRSSSAKTLEPGGAKPPAVALPERSVAQKEKQSPRQPVPQASKPKRRVGSRPIVPNRDLRVPAILLEGDAPALPSASGPGLRYALAPQPVAAVTKAAVGELPEAYGTGRVFLAARDPHWLYASWDFAPDRLKELNSRSRDGHLILRVFAEGEATPSVPEVHVHPESRNWFINVPRAETRYRAEIGFYGIDSSWSTVSVSQSTFAPPEAPSEDLSAQFATIPPQVTYKQVVEAVQQFVAKTEGQPLLEAVAEAQRAQEMDRPYMDERGRQKDPSTASEEPAGLLQQPETDARSKRSKPSRKTTLPVRIEADRPWSREQRASLKRLIYMDDRRRVFIGSLEITELVRRQLEEEELSSIAAQEGEGMPPEEGARRIPPLPGAGISSFAGGEAPKARARKFWFKVNAEMIIYGATEADATVTVADRTIKLRPDGTFSFRFSLPDGRYQLPALAVSSDGEETREARMEFVRSTEYHGSVEAHPQDLALRPPDQREQIR